MSKAVVVWLYHWEDKFELKYQEEKKVEKGKFHSMWELRVCVCVDDINSYSVSKAGSKRIPFHSSLGIRYMFINLWRLIPK